MKVILNQTVPKVGKEGTIVNVADGYARNYLFPRGLAVVATKQQIAALEKRNARIAEKTAGLKTTAEALREKLNGKYVKIAGEVGGQGKLFGAITKADVVEAIKTQLGETVESKQVALIEPIKKLGSHVVELDLHREVEAKVTVLVFDPKHPIEEPVAEAETEEEE